MSFPPSLGQPGHTVVYHPCPAVYQRASRTADDAETTTATASASGTRAEVGPFAVDVPPASLPHIFAHRQWRAGMVLADLLAARAVQLSDPHPGVGHRAVLELGCGTALPALVAAAVLRDEAGGGGAGAGAGVVLATDYDEAALVAALRANVRRAIADDAARGTGAGLPVKAAGYTWGTSPDDLFDLLPLPADPTHRSAGPGFDTILLADTLWDPLSHADLAKSLAHTLRRDARARVLVVCGLHTGRGRLGEFVRRVGRVGLEVAPSPAGGRRRDGASGASTDLWDALELVAEPDLILSYAGADANADDAWAEHVLEFELALEPGEAEHDDPHPDAPAPQPTLLSTPAPAGPSAPPRTLLHAHGPRLTGRRRTFVPHERLRPDEAKEHGGVHVRNRWMTLWALRWRAGELREGV